MLNTVIPTKVVENYGIKFDSRGRKSFFILSAITRAGKHYGKPQWSRVIERIVPVAIVEQLVSA